MVAPVHGGDILAAAARWGLEPSDVIDFSANISPFGPPAAALTAARAALGSAHHYPEPYARTLRTQVAVRHGLPREAILVGNGAAEVIHLLARAAAGGTVAVPAPGFAEYTRAAQAVGAEVVTYPPARPPLDLARSDLLFLCNPHNPTGLLLPPEAVLTVAEATPATVVVDEAFIDLTDAGEGGSVIRHVLHRPNLVVVRSLTKFYAMPGLRVGYGAAHPDRVALLDGVRDPWSVSPVALAAALAAITDAVYAGQVRQWIREERPWLAARLAELPGYRVTPPSANFILVEAPEPAPVIQERLGPRGILIRDCRSFAGLSDCHMRLAVRSRAENLRLLEALAQ